MLLFHFSFQVDYKFSNTYTGTSLWLLRLMGGELSTGDFDTWSDSNGVAFVFVGKIDVKPASQHR